MSFSLLLTSTESLVRWFRKNQCHNKNQNHFERKLLNRFELNFHMCKTGWCHIMSHPFKRKNYWRKIRQSSYKLCKLLKTSRKRFNYPNETQVTQAFHRRAFKRQYLLFWHSHRLYRCANITIARESHSGFFFFFSRGPIWFSTKRDKCRISVMDG